MRQFMRWVRRVIDDLINLRNVDAYVVAFVGIALIILDLLGTVDISTYLAVMTAALVVLVFRAATPPGQQLDLDDVLRNRQSYGPLREFIRGAHEIWVYGPSAVNVLRDSPDIKREVLDKGGSLRVLVQDPQESSSMSILNRQLDPNNDLKHDIEGTLFKLDKMRAWGSVDYRLLDYTPGFSLLIVDPSGKDGRLTIEFFGYHNELISDRMHIVIERRSSQYWFEHWVEQYEIMWKTAHPQP